MRTRKWASDAERKRATRQAANPDKTDADVPFNPDTDTKTDAQSGHGVRIETKTDTPIEQWRIDAQVYLRTGKLPTPPCPSPGFVAFKDQPHVPHDPQAAPWLGAGRGVVREYKGRSYVLVARHRGPVDPDALEHGVVTATDHAARLGQRCEHKRTGWQCHQC